MLNRLRLWWTLDARAEQQSADNPFGPLAPHQRRDTGPVLVYGAFYRLASLRACLPGLRAGGEWHEI